MKKFVLVVITLCLLGLLIALNYLLWDNKNKSDDINELIIYKDSCNLTLESLQNENLSIKDENEEYEDTITNYLYKMNSYQNTIESLNNDLASTKEKLAERDIMIEFLKKIMNTEMFTDIINDWVTSINQKEYSEAYEIQNLKDAFETKQVISFEKFKSLFTNVERIDIKSVEVNLNDVIRMEKQEVAFTVMVDVKMHNPDEESASQATTIMYEGMNRAVIVFKYNDISDNWYIYQMTFYRYTIIDS